MALEGNIVNGKFVDLHGMVYQITPPGAEILNSTDGSDTKDMKNTKNTTPSNGNGNGGNKTKQPKYKPPSPPATPPTPQATEQPPAAPAAQSHIPQTPPPISPNYTYPKCISFEILRAVQTPSMTQVSVRAHCKGQFADAVVHYDFEVYEQAPGMNIIQFKQTALQSAHAEAVQIAKKLLCEQPEAKEAKEAKKEVKK